MDCNFAWIPFSIYINPVTSCDFSIGKFLLNETSE
ncbi:uncharacterized protein J3R85_005120 [Psidium guajava]|nr:uncharacterized protein J3R85_005120 [Psidium guajava]